MNHFPARRPECRAGHGYMELRPLERQSPEQRFCGTWYDCIECGASTLYESPELRDFLKELRGEQEVLPL